ncbi:MAG: biotin carboxylase N-terminal domain-containing protein [bacterium]
MKRVLIANRGEIAVRIIRTLKKLGVYTISIYSEVDKNNPHAHIAHESYNLHDTLCYLDIDKIVETAKKAKADAIHPGYGFLSENYLFAKACKDNNIIFIGPSPESIEILGDKVLARKIAQEVQVPIPPGMDITTNNPEEIHKYAQELGYPIMIKAAKGGGGKGIRVVYNPKDLIDSIQAAKREALAAFKDDSVYIEKYFENPRHIEVQIFGDHYGNVIHLNLRECSIQRKHQKLIEEAPALDEQMQNQIAQAAIKIAKKVNYYNAGTVEFIYKDGKFYFLEVNTRLQVEHPVTEMITGLDLVELQYLIAMGHKVPEKVNFNGHSIECRITAEDPENNFMPVTGKIKYVEFPPNARIDTFIEPGTEISPYYDSLICKVITKGNTRHEAIQNMIYALKNLIILPIKTNKNLLLSIISSKEFQEGQVHTNFIQQYFQNWKETYQNVLDENIISALYYKFGNMTKNQVWLKTPARNQTQKYDLSIWKA